MGSSGGSWTAAAEAAPLPLLLLPLAPLGAALPPPATRNENWKFVPLKSYQTPLPSSLTTKFRKSEASSPESSRSTD